MGPGRHRTILAQRSPSGVKRRSIGSSTQIVAIVAALAFIAFVHFRTDVKFQSASPSIRTVTPFGPDHSQSGDSEVLADPVHQGAELVSTDSERVLIASHNRLFWYYYKTDETKVLHENQGVHYGVFPGTETKANGEPTSVWVVIRPHNWHPKTSEEFLVELEADTGVELNRVQIPTRFTHDAVRRGNQVFVCNTEAGEVLELALPDLHKVRSMKMFTRKEHVNTLAPMQPGELWVVLHNLGDSDVVKLDVSSDPAKEVTRYRGVGKKAHGLVSWHGSFVMLDSDNSAVQLLDPTDGATTRLWQAPEGGKFLKGLTVVDDIAFFGISVWSDRQARGSADSDSELGAFDLTSGHLLWRRKVPTHGLLNIVAAPHLAESSTYIAAYTSAKRRHGAAAKTDKANQVTDSRTNTLPSLADAMDSLRPSSQGDVAHQDGKPPGAGIAKSRRAGAESSVKLPGVRDAVFRLSGTRPRPSADSLSSSDGAIEDALMTVRMAEEPLGGEGGTLPGEDTDAAKGAWTMLPSRRKQLPPAGTRGGDAPTPAATSPSPTRTAADSGDDAHAGDPPEGTAQDRPTTPGGDFATKSDPVGKPQAAGSGEAGPQRGLSPTQQAPSPTSTDSPRLDAGTVKLEGSPQETTGGTKGSSERQGPTPSTVTVGARGAAKGDPEGSPQEATSGTEGSAAAGVPGEAHVGRFRSDDPLGDEELLRMGPTWRLLRSQGLAQAYTKRPELPLPERFLDAMDWAYNRSGYPPLIDGAWLNGRPRLSTKVKKTDAPWVGGVQLPLFNADMKALKDRVLAMPEAMWKNPEQEKSNAIIGGRSSNMAQFKPGVDAIMLIFSDQSGANVYRFPYYDYFKEALEPLLQQILGVESRNIIRLQLARMNPGVQIKLHRDMGGYAKDGHRIHAVVSAHEDVRFEICPGVDEMQQRTSVRLSELNDTVDGHLEGCLPIALYEGLVFEINNRIIHRVVNTTPQARIQLIVDLAEWPRQRQLLVPGARCDYVHAVITCPDGAVQGAEKDQATAT